jgi:hypothetical protein
MKLLRIIMSYKNTGDSKMTVNTNDRYKKLNPETPVSFFFKNIEYKAQETTASNINRSPE